MIECVRFLKVRDIATMLVIAAYPNVHLSHQNASLHLDPHHLAQSLQNSWETVVQLDSVLPGETPFASENQHLGWLSRQTGRRGNRKLSQDIRIKPRLPVLETALQGRIPTASVSSSPKELRQDFGTGFALWFHS